MKKFINSKEAVSLVRDNDTIAFSGFAGLSVPESLISALEKRYLESGYPRNLTLMFAAAQGDGGGRGLNHMAHKGLIKRVIGGHFNLAPRLAKLMYENHIEGYNFPQGVMCNIFRDIARKSDFTLSKIGLGTFVDPRLEGGKVNSITNEDMVELIEMKNSEYLLYHHRKINVAFIKASYCDESGNISLESEATYSEAFIIAQAVRNCGGTVIVQVDKIVSNDIMKCKNVNIPRLYADYIVLVSDIKEKEQVLGMDYDPQITSNTNMYDIDVERFLRENNISEKTSPRTVIGRRAEMELKKGDVVNIGIGMPEEISKIAFETGMNKYITLTVEPGPIGGIPQSGKRFGASINPECILDQLRQFDFYDGGGLDVAFLGLAECDKMGNINVSKFAGKLAGCGGFINITQNAKRLVFCGTFTAKGLKADVCNGKIDIVNEGLNRKFKNNIEQITFNGERAIKSGHKVMYITERAVFELFEDGLHLIEIAPGIDVKKDIMDMMEFTPIIDKDIKLMDENLFI